MPAAPRRRLASFLLPALALLALATVAGLLWLPPADSAQAQTAQTVPADWALIPNGIAPGDSFRLLFVTSASRNASPTDVADYNAHVQTAADSNASLKPFKGEFTALISTSAVDARINTATTGTGMPIHWLGGDKVADDYADLYDGDWDSVSGRTESGGGYTGLVWTGGNKMGEKSGQRYAGAAEVRLGDLSDATLPLSSPNAGASSETHPIYALSPVLTVAQPQPSNHEPQFASDTTNISVNEDAAVGASAGNPVTATDADSDVLTYGIAGSDAFTINASTGQVSVASALNYEATTSYTLTVSVSDRKDATGETDTVVDDTIAVTVAVGNVDEAGTVSLSMDADPPQVGSSITATLLDPDGGVSNVSWSWARSADKATWETIDGATSAAYTPTSDDEGQYLRATVAYGDGQGPGKTAQGATAKTVTAAPTTPESEPAITAGPVITSSPASSGTYGKDEAIEVSVTFSEAVTVTGGPKVRLVVGERKRWAHYSRAENNGTTLVFAYTVKAEDHDDNGVSLPRKAIRLNGGAIEDADGNAAILSAPALSDQSGHQVDGSRQASDDSQSSQQQQQSPPANSPPVFAGNSATLSVAEDAAIGANVGDPVTATDADNDTLTYSLADSDAFAIGEATGQITVAGALDYETAASYTLTVSVRDGKNADGEVDPSVDVSISVTVSVVNVDEPGSVILAAAPRAGMPVTAEAQDPDGDATGVSWSWARSADQVTWETIDGATQASYTPADSDVLYYLRATAAYTDPQGPGKTASGVTLNPVAPRLQFQPQGMERKPVSGIAITSSPASGDSYATGETIQITVTFPKAVTVTGTPALALTIGRGSKDAAYNATLSNPKALVFEYTVVGTDMDPDGVSIPASDVSSSITDPDSTLYKHTGLPGQAGHKVNAALATPLGPRTVPSDWPLIPDSSLTAGKSFRLLFATTALTNAESTDIDDYNALVQKRAAVAVEGNLLGFSGRFRVLGSTMTVDARDNTDTAPAGANYVADEGEPIYWLKGDMVADDYADFYDGSWDSRAGRTESRRSSYTGEVWTGSKADGTKANTPLGGGARDAGLVLSSSTAYGNLGESDQEINSGSTHPKNWLLPLYALSPVITVEAPPGIAGLVAQDKGSQVQLTWTNPASCNTPACSYQYRYRVPGYAWTAWTNTDSVMTQTVTGLNIDTTYEFEVRRRQAGATLAQSAVTATTVVNRVVAEPADYYSTPMAATTTAGSPWRWMYCSHVAGAVRAPAWSDLYDSSDNYIGPKLDLDGDGDAANDPPIWSKDWFNVVAGYRYTYFDHDCDRTTPNVVSHSYQITFNGSTVSPDTLDAMGWISSYTYLIHSDPRYSSTEARRKLLQPVSDVVVTTYTCDRSSAEFRVFYNITIEGYYNGWIATRHRAPNLRGETEFQKKLNDP